MAATHLQKSTETPTGEQSETTPPQARNGSSQEEEEDPLPLPSDHANSISLIAGEMSLSPMEPTSPSPMEGKGAGAATLITPNPIPAPFSRPQPSQAHPHHPPPQRHYSVPTSLPAQLPSSVSAPSFPTAVMEAGSPSNGSLRSLTSPHSKIESIKNWSISTYKCTKQLMFEKLGKSARTVDSELESRIEHLREIKRRYLQVLGLSRAFTSHFYHVIQSQGALAEVFADLAQKSPELQQEFLYNAETQRNLHKNGEVLLSALNFFLSSVNTLCNKTIEDTILTIRQYENSRLEYDAYRSDLELLLQLPKSEATAQKVEEAQRNFNLYKISYEKLREDVNVKLQFLDENRIKVMHKQLLLFHNAISAYFSGNQQALEATLKQFSIKVRSPNAATPSWLEQQQ